MNSWLRLRGYYRRRAGRLLFKRLFTINPQRPLISFTFDDFPRSALLIGGNILNCFGLAGTYYASFGLMGRETPTGTMFVADDLDTLFKHGHELGCHTFSHCDSWDTKTDTFEKAILQNRVALNDLFPGAEFKSFSYPISLPRPLTKARTAEHFLCCRGGGQTLNVGRVDLNQLSAYFLEKGRDNVQAIEDLIDRNQRARGWLIFATHDISDNPTPFGCTPGFFEHVAQYAVTSGARILPVAKALAVLETADSPQDATDSRSVGSRATPVGQLVPTKPLVSILIPAFNAQGWISDTLRSAIAQTWERKEIIVVDDGSTDRTFNVARNVARKLGSDNVRVVSQKNQGAAAARNRAFFLSRGDYIQWLDADDLLAPDKISRQMALLDQGVSRNALLSSGFGKFLYRWHCAKFAPTGLWENLSPTEWLLRKMGQNLYMQTATWLVSRELSEAAGPWDTRMLSDDDGEYFCRVLLKSDGTRFLPEAKVYYRGFGYDSLAYIGKSNNKREALWLSMQLHIGYLRSLEDSPRTRSACVTYLQRNLIHFYPDRPDIVRDAKQIAESLGGRLRPPDLQWKYCWIKTMFGWTAAKNTSLQMRRIRWSLERSLDKAMLRFGSQDAQPATPYPQPELASENSSGLKRI